MPILDKKPRYDDDYIRSCTNRKDCVYAENVDYYQSRNPKLYEKYMRMESAGISPNNYAPSSYARYIVDILTGYIASPGYVEYASDDEAYLEIINKINKENNEPTVTNQEVREGGIQGIDYELHFLEKDDNNEMMPRFLPVKGFECYPIFTDDIDPKLKAMIRTVKKSSDEYQVWVYEKDVMQQYKILNNKVTLENEEPNLYNDIPWNIGRNNIDFEPDFKQVLRYIDIIDALQTNTLNALDKNGRATILTSMESPEIAKDLKDINMIQGMEKGDDSEGKDFFEYLALELNPDLREHMLDHFINELHKISGIFDFTKLDLGQDPSGTALKFRIYPMDLKASEKVAYRLEFLRRRYKLITGVINKVSISGGLKISNADVDDLEITMKRNIPDNIKGILEENNLMGITVDDQTKRERIPTIDAEKVEKRLEDQAETEPFEIDDTETVDNGDI